MTEPYNPSDQCLLEQLKTGDSSAFKTIYNKYWDKLYGIALNRLSDSYEAEEVVQDIYVKLWNNREKLTIETEFSRYLSGAVKYEVINRLAKRARILNSVEKVTEAFYLTDNEDIHHRIDLKNLLNDVDQTILNLPSQCKIVFSLSRKEHYTHQMIANKLGISEKSVQKHITVALKILRKKYSSFLTLILFFI
jgi:RNA polymerase sigma-70 factor (family 1)